MAYKTNHKEKKRIYDKEYRKKNIERIRAYDKKRSIKNSKVIVARVKKWKEENYEKYRDVENKRQKRRMKTDPMFRLNRNTSTAIRISLGGRKSGRRWEKLVNYTLQDLIRHLESQFDENMCWNNYGSYWHIDHKTPLSWFNFETIKDDEFKECWALNNLQPLEASDNIRKNNKYCST